MKTFNLDEFMSSEEYKEEMERLKDHGADANFTGILKEDIAEYMGQYKE